MKIIHVLTALVAFGCGLTAAFYAPKTQDQSDSCHWRELDLCLAPIAVFTQNSNANPVNVAEVNNQCKMLTETEGCLSNFTAKCMTDHQAGLVDLLTDGALDTIRSLCNKSGSRVREQYLKHGTCINSQQKGQKVCMKNFQAALEKAVEIEWQDRLKLACCSFNKLNACVKDLIEPKCGKEAYELSQTFFKTSFSRMPTITCNKYDHNSKVCASLLPPAGTVPKGSKSHSALSKLLSMYTATN